MSETISDENQENLTSAETITEENPENSISSETLTDENQENAPSSETIIEENQQNSPFGDDNKSPNSVSDAEDNFRENDDSSPEIFGGLEVVSMQLGDGNSYDFKKIEFPSVMTGTLP